MPSDDCLKKLYIEPTARCNLRCKMCFRNSWKNEIIGDMRPETFRKAMTTMPDSVETVFFGGMGEPLAHPDIVEMVRTASSLGKRVELLSNGTLLDARRTAELLDAGLDMLWLSIDALDDGRYAQIRRNSQLALVKEHIVEFNRQRARLDRTVRLGVAFVVMKSNAHELALLPYFSTYYKVNEVNISNVIPTDEHTASEVLYNNVVDWGLGDPAPMESSPRIHLPLMDWQDPAAQEGLRSLLEQALSERRGGPVRLVAPQNPADNRLVDVAQSNAREEARRREKLEETPLPERLARALHLPGAPRRIECVDVSHTGGRQTRVGMVVYEDGRPSPDQYRAYAMPDGGDDYGTLYAWVARRLESGPPWPDLMLIDGGRGQLAVVERALADAGKADFFPLAAIAKARDEAGHADRRAGNVADRIFLPGRSNPLPLREGCAELLFLQNVRDATHRFAIGRHRKARGLAALSGELMRLPGIGPATARLLWETFGSLEAMRAASVEDLRRLPGIGASRAALLHEKLKGLEG